MMAGMDGKYMLAYLFLRAMCQNSIGGAGTIDGNIV
jgi:hypothetical protein